MMPKKETPRLFTISNELYTKVCEWAWDNYYRLILIHGNDDYVIFQDHVTKNIGVAFRNKEIAKTHSVAVVFELAKAIANQPSDELQRLAFTEDLEDEWKIQRATSRSISSTFLTSCLGINIDLIKNGRRQIHQAILEILELIGYQYRALWDLVKLTFPYIKKANKGLRFTTAKELFLDIVTAQRNSNYEQLFQKDYLEFLSFDIADKSKFFDHEWLNHVLYVANTLAKKSRKARLLNKFYEDACEELNQAITELSSIRTEDGMLVKSEVWKHGVCFILDRYNKPSIHRAALKNMLNET